MPVLVSPVKVMVGAPALPRAAVGRLPAIVGGARAKPLAQHSRTKGGPHHAAAGNDQGAGAAALAQHTHDGE